MEITLTVTTTPEIARQILDVLGEGSVSVSAPLSAGGPGEGLRGFVTRLTALGRQAVRKIAARSATGAGISRDELASEMKLDREVLNGVMGGIGVHWARTPSGPNPFRARHEIGRGPVFRLDRELARRLLDMLKED